MTSKTVINQSAEKEFRLIYLSSKFPLLSETFIYEELLALQEAGYQLRFFSFYDTGQSAHQYAEPLRKILTYLPAILSWAHVVAQWMLISSRPKVYFKVLGQIIKETWRSPAILGKSLYAFAKGVCLTQALSAKPPDHLHAHWATMPTTSVWVVSKFLGIPYSFTGHAWDIFKEPAMLTTKLKTAAFSVTISDYNRQYLRQLMLTPTPPIYIIRCGVNLERFSLRQNHLLSEPPVILTVARLMDKKGLTDLVKACAELHQQGVDFECIIVGDGPQRQTLEKLIETHNLQKYVKLTGGLPQEKLHPLWHKANVFVLPCVVSQDGNRDGIPVVLMEAMALGIPVISTQVSGIPELVEDGVTGLLVPPHDVVQLSEAIKRLLNDNDLAMQLVKAARKRVEDEYDIRQNAKDKALLFSTTLASPPIGDR